MNKINIKQLIFYIPIIILIFIGINYFLFYKPIKKEIIVQYKEIPQKEIIKEVRTPTRIIKEKVAIKTIIKYIEKPILKQDKNVSSNIKPIVKNIMLDDVQDYDIKTKDETIFLTTRYDKFKNYKISLKSSKKIISTLPSGSYILLNGTIEKNNIKSKFDLSFNEYYSQFSENLYLEVINRENNTTIKCDGSFLNGVTSEYNYDIQLDIMGDLLSCYIVSQKEMPNIQKILKNNSLKSLNINDLDILKTNKSEERNKATTAIVQAF